MDLKTKELTYGVLACLFAALISIGAYIAVPLPGTPVPIVLQNMFIILAAIILGPLWALVSVSIYLIFGMVGLPVFSGGTGGIAKIVGPTGGYLIGYIPATLVIGLISQAGKSRVIFNILGSLVGMMLVYLVGVARLKMVLDSSWDKALAAGFYPFLIGDAIKIVLASFIAPRIREGIIVLSESEGDA